VPQAPTQPRETAEPLDDEDEEMEHELPKEVVVWGHGGTVDEGSDMFVRGVREWVGFAESMHCDEEGEEGQSNAVETS
jgi:ribonuclease H2 subunit C